MIAKVLVTEKTNEIERVWFNLGFDETDGFIHKRIKSYLDEIYRMCFPSILQYINLEEFENLIIQESLRFFLNYSNKGIC